MFMIFLSPHGHELLKNPHQFRQTYGELAVTLPLAHLLSGHYEPVVANGLTIAGYYNNTAYVQKQNGLVSLCITLFFSTCNTFYINSPSRL